jgi:hypothetical protein
MTTNRILPFGVMAAIIIAVLTALSVAGAIDDEGDGLSVRESGDGENFGVAGLCVEGTAPEDCNDMIVNADVDGDDAVDAPPPADDGGGLTQACLEGNEDCVDTPLDPDEPVSNSNDGDPATRVPGEELAIDASFTALEKMGGSSTEVSVTGIRAVEWGDSCLGVLQEGIACAEVITPGYIVFLSGDQDWEFHTDLNGNAVFSPN